MMRAALKCPDNKPLVGYFIVSLKNKLYDISFRRKKYIVKHYEEFKAREADLDNLFDHKKIGLLKKSNRHVYFYENDLNVLKDDEKNFLALYSQIPCTNKIAARRMGFSESKISRIWGRLNIKLMPAYIRNQNRQQPGLDTIILDQQSAWKAPWPQVRQLFIEKSMGIERPHFAGLDGDTDFNQIPQDSKTQGRIVACERERERLGFEKIQ